LFQITFGTKPHQDRNAPVGFKDQNGYCYRWLSLMVAPALPRTPFMECGLFHPLANTQSLTGPGKMVNDSAI
jgi:hypothetical protein